MSTKVLMDVEEYLRTSFDGADCEYLEGEIVERNMGEWSHARVQWRVQQLLGRLESSLGIQIAPEIRIQIKPRRFRVADIAVWRPGNVGGRIPTVPPFLAIEILSPEDRVVRIKSKIQDYFSIGVEWIWYIDPWEKSALCYSQKNPVGAVCDVLRTDNPLIEIPLASAFTDVS